MGVDNHHCVNPPPHWAAPDKYGLWFPHCENPPPHWEAQGSHDLLCPDYELSRSRSHPGTPLLTTENVNTHIIDRCSPLRLSRENVIREIFLLWMALF